MKAEVLQMGSYPEWHALPLEQTFVVHRYFEAVDKAAFLAEIGPRIQGIATRGELGASRAIIATRASASSTMFCSSPTMRLERSRRVRTGAS